MSAADTAIDLIIMAEGGLSSDPADRAVRDLLPGETVHTGFGIRQSTYNAYRRAHKQPVQPVRLISVEEVRDIYRTGYWQEAGCDLILATGATATATCTFDAAVQHGPARATGWLQQLIGAKADGVFGPASTAALTAHLVGTPDNALADQLLRDRQRFYDALVQSDPSQARFARGWTNRLTKLRRALGLKAA